MTPGSVPSQIQVYKKAGGYKIRPATYATGQGATVTFFNASPARVVRLLFPEAIFAGVGPGPVDIPAGQSVTLTVGSAEPGVYPYAAYYFDPTGEKDFAAGESGPVIIIDR
jgi:hypothetical protein